MTSPSPTGPRVVIAGGRGFIGTSLSRFLLDRGFRVTILSRQEPTPASEPRATPEFIHWDARTLGDWAQSLNNAAAVINLVGRSVDCIKTPDHCDEILRSRVESVRILGEACRRVAVPPPVWVQMSTAHIYGDPPAIRCDETSPTGHGLAPDVGRAWEAAFEQSRLPTQRAVVLRTGFVIGRPNSGGRGALGKLTLLARLGLGGRVGRGSQGMSWIHETDFNRIVERAITNPSPDDPSAPAAMSGIYNVTSPNPVPQHEFARTLRRHAGGLGALGLALPAPAWLVRLAAPLVLRTDPELALYGRFVLPERLRTSGFEFAFPDLSDAIANLMNPR